MTIDYRHGVSLVELIVYIPTLFLALWMAFRHGFGKSAGWLGFVVFALARVVGAVAYLLTLHYETSKDLYIAYSVCTGVALSPLTTALIGLLSRANDSIQRKTGNGYNSVFFKVAASVTFIAALLCIIGSTSNNYSDPSKTVVNSKTKIGLVIYVISWLVLCLLLLMVGARVSSIEDGERRLILAVALSAPLLFVRLVYSLLTGFSNNKNFNLLEGNVTIMILMSIIEEFLIVFICLGIGLTLQVRPNVPVFDPNMPVDPYEPYAQPSFDDQPAKYGRQNASYMMPPDNYGRQNEPYMMPPDRRSRRGRRGGPITQLVGLVMDSSQSRRY